MAEGGEENVERVPLCCDRCGREIARPSDGWLRWEVAEVDGRISWAPGISRIELVCHGSREACAAKEPPGLTWYHNHLNRYTGSSVPRLLRMREHYGIPADVLLGIWERLDAAGLATVDE